MKDILLNIANRELLAFCKENGVDPSGTYAEKAGRGYKYNLIKQSTGQMLVSVTFTKNNTPDFRMSEEAQAQRKDKIERLRTNMPGYILGNLTPFATDSDVLEICEINDRKAAIHNRAISQKKYRG